MTHSNTVVLVTGGCGCVGFHVVRALLEEPSVSAIHVFSRNPTQNRLSKVIYHAGNITSDDDVGSLIADVKPHVIFHIASPVSSGNTQNAASFHAVNVEGTKTLLRHAQSAKETKAFIYTSSASVARPPYRSVTEAQPLIPTTSKTSFNYYAITKAIADTLVLEANRNDGLRTCCLRITVVYGERDKQLIPGVIKVLDDKKHTNQIGDNKSLMDFLSVKNAARAHVLAYKALMSPKAASEVAGEAFFITDGRPIPFWDFSRKVWAAAGDRTPPEKIKVIPAWLVLGLAVALEWAYWVVTFGQRTPEFLRSHTIRYVTQERTFSIEKARNKLGYMPRDEMDEGIEADVAWYLKERRGLKTD